MTQGQTQEMLFKPQPPQEQQEEEQKFGGGGGGGPKAFFSSSSSMSSIVCRPDPNNPHQQICKKVVKESSIDPLTGKRTERNVEKEEAQPFD
jgi:hypothetical protein